jgi:hypothetical protein
MEQIQRPKRAASRQISNWLNAAQKQPLTRRV